MKKVFTNILTMMMVLSVGTMFISCEDEPEPQRPDTPGEEGHWTAGTKPYSINVNPYNGDIIVNSDGDYTATGDCFIFTNDLKVRLGATELGMLPSKSVALACSQRRQLGQQQCGHLICRHNERYIRKRLVCQQQQPWTWRRGSGSFDIWK